MNAHHAVRPAEQIRDLAQNASIEAPLASVKDFPALRGFLPPAGKVFLNVVPRLSMDDMVAAAALLRRRGYEPVPHIAARLVNSRSALNNYVSRLCGEADVRQALIIGGDVPSPAGPFSSAAELLETGIFDAAGFETLGIAGYPEGHPKIAVADLDAALERKRAVVARTGVQLEFVTQVCFDAAAIINWRARLRERGIGCPVRVGIPGPTSLRTMVRYAAICGVGPSARLLRRNAWAVGRLAGAWDPGRLVTEVAKDLVSGGAADTHLHLFSFGGIERTARWLAQLRDGRFTLARLDRRIRTEERV